jgi:hypothetical protein
MCLCDTLSAVASSRDVIASRTGTGTPVADSMCTTLPLRQLPSCGRLPLLAISCTLEIERADQHRPLISCCPTLPLRQLPSCGRLPLLAISCKTTVKQMKQRTWIAGHHWLQSCCVAGSCPAEGACRCWPFPAVCVHERYVRFCLLYAQRLSCRQLPS